VFRKRKSLRAKRRAPLLHAPFGGVVWMFGCLDVFLKKHPVQIAMRAKRAAFLQFRTRGLGASSC